MLDGVSVLVVEDEFFIALELATEIAVAGGEVVGPYATVADALKVLATRRVAAAILDANLIDRDVTPVALQLLAQGVPLVIHTGVGVPSEVVRSYPNVPVLMKPAEPQLVLAALTREMARRASWHPGVAVGPG